MQYARKLKEEQRVDFNGSSEKSEQGGTEIHKK